jgi:hypothetical protein
MYCPQCGATNDDSAGSCGACAYDLGKYRQQWEVAETPEAAGASGPAAPNQAPPQQAPGYGQQAPPYQAPPYQAPPNQAPAYGQQPYQGQYGPGPHQGPPYPQQPYQRYYPAPPYQPGQYTPGPYGMLPRVPSYLGWAIAVLILCFWPTAIPAVVFASQVDNRLAMGDVNGAMESSRKAKMWCWISFGIAIGFWVLAIIAIVIIAIVGAGVSSTIY